MADKALWRKLFDAAEQAVTPRVERLVRTSEFTRGTALAMHVQSHLKSQLSGLSARAWHTVNLPAGSDLVRLRVQLAAIDRELRRLSIRIELEERSTTDRPEPPADA